jgi:hypothetical protein
VGEEGEEAEVDMLHVWVQTISGCERRSDKDIYVETLLHCVLEEQQVLRTECGLVLGSEL